MSETENAADNLAQEAVNIGQEAGIMANEVATDRPILRSPGNNVDQIVVDVGGFLGMGEHGVAVTMEELHIMRSDDGSELRVYMDATQEELEAQPV